MEDKSTAHSVCKSCSRLLEEMKVSFIRKDTEVTLEVHLAPGSKARHVF